MRLLPIGVRCAHRSIVTDFCINFMTRDYSTPVVSVPLFAVLDVSCEHRLRNRVPSTSLHHRLSINRLTKRGKENSRSGGHCQCEKEMEDHLLLIQWFASSNTHIRPTCRKLSDVKTRFRCHSVAVKLKRTDRDSMKFKSRLIRPTCKKLSDVVFAH
jgi:hypothetical protein